MTLTLRLSTKPRIGTRTPRGAGLARWQDGCPRARCRGRWRRAASRARSSGRELAVGVSADQGHLAPGATRRGASRRRRGTSRSIHFSAPRATASRDGEGRPWALDDVQPLHAEGLARADDRRAVVRVVRARRTRRRRSRGAAPMTSCRRAPPGLGHERLEHADDVLGVVRLGAGSGRRRAAARRGLPGSCDAWRPEVVPPLASAQAGLIRRTSRK